MGMETFQSYINTPVSCDFVKVRDYLLHSSGLCGWEESPEVIDERWAGGLITGKDFD